MRFATMVLATALAGCAASGVQVSEQMATQFKEGTSTEIEIVKALGPPTSVTVSSGKRFISYTGMQYQVKGASFIPIVGAFAGGSDYKMSVAMFQIDPAGVLEKITYTTSGSGTRSGVQPVAMPTTEPRAVK